MSSHVNAPAPPPSADAGPSATADPKMDPPPSPPAPVHGVKRILSANEWNVKGSKSARTKLRDNAAPLKLAQKRRLSRFRTMQNKAARANAKHTTVEGCTGIPGQDLEPATQGSTTPVGSPRGLGSTVLDTDVEINDENGDIGSDMDDEEVDAIIDEYDAGDEDEGDERMTVSSQLQPAVSVAHQPGPSQVGTYPLDQHASHSYSQHGNCDAIQHNAHVQHSQVSHPPDHYTSISYSQAPQPPGLQAASPYTHTPQHQIPYTPAPYAQQLAAGIPAQYAQQHGVGVPAQYAQQLAAGTPAQYTQQQAAGTPAQYAQHGMGVPAQYAQQQATGTPAQYAQHGVGVPAQYAQQQAAGTPAQYAQHGVGVPAQYAQQQGVGVPAQYHPQRQAAYAPIHQLQDLQSQGPYVPAQYAQGAASHYSFASAPYPSSGNQQGAHAPPQPALSAEKQMAPQNPPGPASDHQLRSRTAHADDSQAGAMSSQQPIQFVTVDPSKPPTQRRRITSTNSLASLPETSTASVGPLPAAAASGSRRKAPSRAPSSKNVGKERAYHPYVNGQRYEPPPDPPAYHPPPQQPRATDDVLPGNRSVAGRHPSASATPGPSRDPRQEIVERLSLLDEADRLRVMAALYPQNHATEMDVDKDTPPSTGKGKSRADKLPALAMVLDKVQRVEDVCRDNAKRSKQFEARVQDTLTQVQQEMAGIKNVDPRARKHTLQARRAVKPPRTPRQSRIMQIEEHLPPDFDTMDVRDREIWLRQQKDQLDLLARHVRTHLKKMLGFQTWEELVKKNPPLSGDQIKLFANPGTSVLDIFPGRRLHFDFEQSWEKFSFNREASKLFVADFLSKVKAGQYSNPPVAPRYLTAHNVASVLTAYMDTCRRKYREVLDPISADEKERRADSSCKNGRRSTLLHQRILTTERRGWDQFDPLWQALTPANMSDDETDSGSKKGKGKVTRRRKRHWPTWTVIRSLWQSDALVEFLHGVDKHYRRDWENPGRYSGKRKSSGQPPRRRYLKETSKVEEGVVPPGLWRNCYNPAWLKTLRPDEIAALQIIDEDFDLKLPAPARDTSDEESDEPDAQTPEDEEME
ncbi:hypothetical protein LXA43DRAFT_1090470 [Ganoderma leucocontextum]|nr:hypothetical protein LXA43DRAFT_1090470 [Ganoderma leucocontextum]